MAQENVPNKPVHLMYLTGGVVFFYLLQWTTDWIWGYFTRSPDEFWITVGSGIVALVTGIVMYKNERIYTLANEVASELKKVAWPNSKEVKVATITVVIMTIISASILGFFDFVWSSLTTYIYG